MEAEDDGKAITIQNWSQHLSVELIDGEIAREKFELSVALAPLIAFSFGGVVLGSTELPGRINIVCILMVVSSGFHYLLLQNNFVLKNVLIAMRTNERAKQHHLSRFYLPYASRECLWMRRIATWANNIGYSLLAWELIF